MVVLVKELSLCFQRHGLGPVSLGGSLSENDLLGVTRCQSSIVVYEILKLLMDIVCDNDIIYYFFTPDKKQS